MKKISQTRTLGISKSNIEYFNKNISNIKKIIWEIKHIKIFTENSIKNEIINFSESRQQLFSIIHNQKLIDQLISELKKNKKFNLKKINPWSCRWYIKSLLKNYIRSKIYESRIIH